MPELEILFEKGCLDEAHIGKVNLKYAELFVSSIFYDSKISKKYLYSILYHEFTHIVDRIKFFTEMEDERQKRNLLFPYNEFYAAQVEITKLLELYYNPKKKIQTSTNIYGINGSSTLKNFLKDEINEFILFSQFLNEHPSIENVQNIMYLLTYNIGYYSVCLKYKIDDNLFINPYQYSYIVDKINDLKKLFLNNEPSDKFCIEAHSMANSVVKEIAHHYNLL